MVWVKLECPHCKATAPVTASCAGQYTQCPNCQARVLVPINAARTEAPSMPAPVTTAARPAAAPTSAMQAWNSSAPSAAGGPPASNGPALGPPAAAPAAYPITSMPAGRAQPASSAPMVRPAPNAPTYAAPTADIPLSPPLAAGPPVPLAGGPPTVGPMTPPQQAMYAPPRAVTITPPGSGAGPGRSVAAPPVTAPPAVGGAIAPLASRKVARFIAADPAQSTIRLAPDGQLPNLCLVEAGQSSKETEKASSMNPLLLLAAIATSFCVSVMLLMTDVRSGGADQERSEARARLESYYRGQETPLAPYQVHLREARQAFSRGDLRTERTHYRKVLDMLHAEGGTRFRGLTGTANSDKQLEELLSTLLGHDTSDAIRPEDY